MTDRRTVLAVAIGLVLVVMLGLGGVVLLALFDHDVPEVLGSIASTAVGALAALLASTRSTPALGDPAALLVPGTIETTTEVTPR